MDAKLELVDSGTTWTQVEVKARGRGGMKRKSDNAWWEEWCEYASFLCTCNLLVAAACAVNRGAVLNFQSPSASSSMFTFTRVTQAPAYLLYLAPPSDGPPCSQSVTLLTVPITRCLLPPRALSGLPSATLGSMTLSIGCIKR